MKIKVGEYIRTKDGVIGKITKIVTDSIFYVQFYDNEPWKTDTEEAGIIKSSPNIIDLIELGDYVNGKEVFINAKEYLIFKDVGSTVYSESISPENIKSIVTHEQFKEMEYKV